MQPWTQEYLPLGHLGLSALAAGAPIIVFFLSLAVFRLKGYIAGLLTLVVALLVAISVYHMPAGMAFASAIYGFAYGIWPIAWIIVAAVFLYKVVVRTGQFDIIRASIISLTDDKRLQMLLIGFSFGAFLEGAAGFGAPVAITAALLVGLGFNPLYAAGLCLIANTAPVAFGALGIPIIVAGQVSGHDPSLIGAMVGRQLPLLSLIMPFWLVLLMDGFKGLREVWPAALVTGGTFGVVQYFTANHIGPELPDVTSALVSLLALGLFLKVWQPASARNRSVVGVTSAGAAVLGGEGYPGGGLAPRPENVYTPGQILKAWSPFLILTAIVTVWSLPSFKALFATGGALYGTVLQLHVPFLDNLVLRTAPVAASVSPMAAVFKWDILAATGTAILISALLSVLLLGLSAKATWETFVQTLVELRAAIVSIGLVLAFAFVENYSGMSSTLALLLAGTGALFPFFSPILGWLGVFLTGSDTSSNALFGGLQATTGQQIGVSSTLMVAANSTGGVAGKMISPQSIAVACAATGLVGKESDLFRFTFKHSVALVILAGVITMAQAYWLTWMIP